MDALELLRAKCTETSCTKVAEDIGYSRTAVSLLVNGRYPGSPERLLAAVVRVYGNIACPFLSIEIPPKECREHAFRPCPTHNPMLMRHWQACQTCPIRPKSTTGDPA
jgi:DNA-binding transcriptional regulator YdaS (Cro superfamily)